MVHGAIPGQPCTSIISRGGSLTQGRVADLLHRPAFPARRESSATATSSRAIRASPRRRLSNVYESMSQFGQGPNMAANGTYTFEFTAPSSGRLAIIGVDDAAGNGFTGSVDSVSITEITTGAERSSDGHRPLRTDETTDMGYQSCRQAWRKRDEIGSGVRPRLGADQTAGDRNPIPASE
jgi:hypothetical protein